MYKPYGNSSTHESGCSVGKDKHWTGLERAGNWGAKYIAMTMPHEERWIIKPSKKGPATYLARLNFHEDNEGAIWRTHCEEEGGLQGFSSYIGNTGMLEVDPQPQTRYLKRKRRCMKHKSSFRVYTLDPNEAAIGARHTHACFAGLVHTHIIDFSLGYIRTPAVSRHMGTNTHLAKRNIIVGTLANCVPLSTTGGRERARGHASVDACAARSRRATAGGCSGVHSESRVQLGRREREWPVARVASGQQLHVPRCIVE